MVLLDVQVVAMILMKVKFAKVERAKVLLKSTPLSVREISEQLGFATRNYFSAVFQQVTGKTPMEFRET